jgi:hypothetical protein
MKPGRANIVIACGVVLFAAACGYDNPGEPRTPAEQLSAPNLGDVHVYCVEQENVTVTECSVTLAGKGAPTPDALRDWWLRAARSLHRAGTFSYKDAEWRFGEVFVQRPKPGGHVTYGWRCPVDARHTRKFVAKLMDERGPGGEHAIDTLAEARKVGCSFGPYPRDWDN